MIADTSTPSASRRAGLADPWAWLCAFAPLVLFAGTRGAARGEPVAEDFDFLRRALLEPHTWWDGGGSLSFWRPVSHQLYYDVLGRLMLTHPLAVSALHGVLLAVATVLLYRLLRGPLGSPLAAAAATFPLLSESTRTLVCWPSHFVDLGVYLFSVLALSEAAARRLPTALAALLAALLCKEVAVVTALLMPFLPGFERPRRVRWAIATALLLAAWAAAYIAVRRHAGLELPHGLEHDPAVRAIGPVSRFGWALWNSVRAIFSLSLRPGPFDGLAAISVGLLATGVAVGLRGAAARARVAATRAWMAWGAAWFLLASATLTSIFPLWSPNRSQFGSAGFGIAATALAGAVHPGLAGLLTGSRLTMFALAPRVPTRISPEPEERGAFIDVPRLTRLQRLMSTARHALLARHPTLAHGDVVVFHNLPLSAEYAFGGPHAVQVWYRDTTLRCVSFDAFKKDSLLRAVALISYQPRHDPQIVILEPAAIRHQLAGVEALFASDWPRALREFDAADSAQHDPRAVVFAGDNAGRRAYALAALGQFDRAESEARRALAIATEDVGARYVLALALARRHELAAARAQLDTVLTRDPANADATALRGQIDAALPGR